MRWPTTTTQGVTLRWEHGRLSGTAQSEGCRTLREPRGAPAVHGGEVSLQPGALAAALRRRVLRGDHRDVHGPPLD